MKAPVFANLAARQSATLRQFVERRLGDLKVICEIGDRHYLRRGGKVSTTSVRAGHVGSVAVVVRSWNPPRRPTVDILTMHSREQHRDADPNLTPIPTTETSQNIDRFGASAPPHQKQNVVSVAK